MQTMMFRLPRLGGAESEARVLAWKKQPGEAFGEGETLLEVETDKAVVDIPAPSRGVLLKALKAVDAYVAFDEALAELEVDDAVAAALVATLSSEAPVDSGQMSTPTQAPSPPPPLDGSPAAARGRIMATPVARKLAAARGVDLARIRGSGPGGRIVRRDVEAGHTVGSSLAAASGRPVDAMVTTPRGDVFVRHWNAGAGGDAGAVTTVLVHGLFADVDTWAAVATALAEQGRPVLAVDLPAHGRTSARAASIAEMAEVLADVLAMTAPGPKLLVGHSLGGAVATRLAQHRAVRQVKSLALIAPAGLGTEINQGFIDGMLHAGTPALMRRELEKLAQRLPDFGDALMAQLHSGLQARRTVLSEVVAGFAVHGTQQVDIRAALASMDLPVTVLWGRLDQVIPWTHALNLPPDVAQHLFASAGHMPQWEASSVLTKILQRLGERAGS